MNERQDAVSAQADRLEREVDHFFYQLEGLEDSEAIHPAQLQLTIQTAKRVRREVTLVLRKLAELRDSLQPQ